MQDIQFGDGCISMLILIKEDALLKDDLIKYYINPLEKLNIKRETIAAYGLLYEDSKVKAELGKAYLRMLLPKLLKLGTVKTLIVADTNYFKWLTKSTKVVDCYGEAFKGKLEGYEDFKIVLVPNYKSLFYNPNNISLINEGLVASVGFKKPGIIKSAQYIREPGLQVSRFTDTLHTHPKLTVDIETTGLTLGIEIVTIAFAWDKHNGGVLYLEDTGTKELKEFLITYKGEMIFHNSLFDCKHLIYNLFMNGTDKDKGRQKGLDVFENVQDSMILAYLAKNSTTEAKLDLKSNALEFAGNYGVNVKNVKALPVEELMEYNLKDCLATWHVYNKFHDKVLCSDLAEAYEEIFQPSIKIMLKMMLTGLPLDNKRVQEVDYMLINKRDSHIKALPSYAEIKKFNFNFRHKSMKEANAKLKKKFRPFSDFIELQFNPSSNNHIRELFYTQLDYEPIDFTDSGEPATGAKTLTKLLKVATIDSHKELLEHLIENNKTSKILNTFIKAFKNYEINGYLHGDLKLGGTQSGRLSSSKPNLQNLPSNSTYGKDIKSCFVAPKGYLWAGADFASLEDRINAILTQDPNKIKVYTDGYDGHCLRAYSYFGNQMPDIKNTVDSINSIETKYPELRQKSKGPTFALTYNGTWHTLVSNIGIPIDEAKQIEKNYHKLYAVSDKFTETQIAHATKHGYMECAFGLQIKTPILASSIYGSTVTPYAVTAEARSANNAVTQSWGMLINRALIATNKLIEQSEFVYDIYPINTIHDAAYFLVKDTPEAISFLNKTLIKEMQWNEHPLIQSKDVLMEADLEIGKSWDKQTSIPNNASITQIKEILNNLGG